MIFKMPKNSKNWTWIFDHNEIETIRIASNLLQACQIKLRFWVLDALLATKVIWQKNYFITISTFGINKLMPITQKFCQIKFECRRGPEGRSNTYDAPCIYRKSLKLHKNPDLNLRDVDTNLSKEWVWISLEFCALSTL